MKTNWMLINGKVRKIKPEITLEFMQNKYPDATIEKIGKLPSEKTMDKWCSDSVAKATDGCRVEPDGICPHGKESWLLVLGYI